MPAAIRSIAVYFPEQILDNAALAVLFPEWPADKIYANTGVKTRHVASESETIIDMAEAASKSLLDRVGMSANEIDYILLCTQTPARLMPSNACTLQDRLGIPQTAGALDILQGCSGYVYSLSLARALINAGEARNVLVVTTEVITKALAENDATTRLLFGDAATATLVEQTECVDGISKSVVGSDGSGASYLYMGGMPHVYGRGEKSMCLNMNGLAIFSFALKKVPEACKSVAQNAGLTLDDIDYFVLHQANAFLLESLRRTMKIPKEKFIIELEDVGNTTSSSIPVALRSAFDNGRIKTPCRVMAVGFGVGLSWAACLIDLPEHW